MILVRSLGYAAKLRPANPFSRRVASRLDLAALPQGRTGYCDSPSSGRACRGVWKPRARTSGGFSLRLLPPLPAIWGCRGSLAQGRLVNRNFAPGFYTV